MRNKDENERDLHRQLKQETDKSIHLKEDTWKNIQQELFTERKEKRMLVKRLGISFGMITAAALLMIVLLSSELFTNRVAEEPNEPDISTNDPEEDPPAKADERLADQYEPEKEMEVELEGMKEPIHMELAVNEEERYVLYIEKDQNTFRASDDEDVILMTGDVDESYPPLAMYIKKEMNTTFEKQLELVRADVKEDGLVIEEEGETDEPIDAYMVRAIESDVMDWNTTVHRYYITEVEEGTFFTFKQTLFQVAMEGQAGRFNLMLETFEYAGEESNQDD